MPDVFPRNKLGPFCTVLSSAVRYRLLQVMYCAHLMVFQLYDKKRIKHTPDKNRRSFYDVLQLYLVPDAAMPE